MTNLASLLHDLNTDNNDWRVEFWNAVERYKEEENLRLKDEILRLKAKEEENLKLKDENLRLKARRTRTSGSRPRTRRSSGSRTR
jgi:hypothetical protein